MVHNFIIKNHTWVPPGGIRTPIAAGRGLWTTRAMGRGACWRMSNRQWRLNLPASSLGANVERCPLGV